MPDYFEPRVFTITGITLGSSTVVSIASSFNYTIGQEVRFVIPESYGSQQLDEMTGFVTALPSSSQVAVNINSIGFSPFITNPAYGPTPPQIVAIGDLNTGNTTINRFNNSNVPGLAAVTLLTTIPGTFQNTSPYTT
jgi:hypothetical protein